MSDVAREPGRSTVTDPIGLLIIRAWFEDGSSEPLRAQVRVTGDLSAGFGPAVTLSRTEEVCVMVREWLHEIQRVPQAEGKKRAN